MASDKRFDSNLRITQAPLATSFSTWHWILTVFIKRPEPERMQKYWGHLLCQSSLVMQVNAQQNVQVQNETFF